MDIKNFIKEKPLISAGIVIFILTIIGVGTWLIVKTPTTSSSSNISTSSNSLNGSVVSNTPQASTGPNTQQASTGPNTPQASTVPNVDVDCVVTYPDTWGPCDPLSGLKSKTGTVTTYPSGNGAQCPPLTVTTQCPVDCVVDYPSIWGPCDPVSGVKTATGTVKVNPKNGGATCPPLTVTAKCPIDCVVNYGAWSRCSYSGVQTATGTIITPSQNGGSGCPSLTKTGACQGIPEFIGCYSSEQKNGENVTTPNNMGIMTVSACNKSAQDAHVPYFGMSYWQGGGAKDDKNIGYANCVLPNSNADPSTVTSYLGAPGGNADNAIKCPVGGPFTPECIAKDTVNACVVNTDTSAPPGYLGGGWVNAIYKTST